MISRRSVEDTTESARERLTGIPLAMGRPHGVRGSVVHTWYGSMARNNRWDERSA